MKNFVKLLFTVLVFALFGFNANAQTVTSTNKANAIVVQSLASVTAPVRGMIVFSKTDGDGTHGAFYVRDYTRWVPLAEVLAANGLTKGTTDNTIRLGGNLTQETIINLSGFEFKLASLLYTTNPTTDDILVADPSTGSVKKLKIADFLNNLTVSNGLTKVGNDIQLGGTLTKPTTIATSATNSLNITGMATATDPTGKNVVITDPTTGALSQITPSDLLKGATTVSNTSSGNNLSTTVNGVTGTAVPIINSNALTVDASNNLTSTVNGVASNVQSLNGLTLTGDVTGTLNATKVEKIQGTAVSATAPTTTNNLLVFDGTSWKPAAANDALVKKDITATGSVVTVTNGAGQVVGASNVNLDVQGSAGGVLYGTGTGTSAAFTGAGTQGQILQSNAAGAPTWTDASSLVTMVAPNASSTPNGGTITKNATTGAAELSLSPADGTNPGIVTTSAQTIAGVKTFVAPPIVQNLTTGANTDNVVVADATGQLKQVTMSNLIVRATLTSTIDFPADGFYLQGKASYAVAGAKVGDVVQVTITNPASATTPQTGGATSAAADTDVTGQAAVDGAGFSITNGYVSADGTVTLTLASAQIIKGSIGVTITVVKGS